jgi:pilus assembly protein Flp/PilA
MKKLLHKLVQDETGAALPEYAVLLGLVLAVSVATLTAMGGSITSIFSKVNAMLTAAAAGQG